MSTSVYNLISDNLITIMIRFLPGILCMELYFNRGFFSNIPSTLYEIILFVFWSLILSIPYVYFIPQKVSHLKDIAFNYAVKSLEESGSFPRENNIKNNYSEGEITLLYILIELVTTYLLFHLFKYLKCPELEFMYINDMIVKYFIIAFVTIIFSKAIITPAYTLFVKVFFKSMIKGLLKKGTIDYLKEDE